MLGEEYMLKKLNDKFVESTNKKQKQTLPFRNGNFWERSDYIIIFNIQFFLSRSTTDSMLLMILL